MSEQLLAGVYDRMHRSLTDHRAGLISFEDMIKHWQEEAKLIQTQLKGESNTTSLPAPTKLQG